MRKTGRRTLLKAAALGLALPLMESLPARDARGRAARGRPQGRVRGAGQEPAPAPAGEGPSKAPARRLVCIGVYLGLYGPRFFPARPGSDYDTPPMLQPLHGLREHFTVFSGLDHRAPLGHHHWRNYLCGAEPGGVSFDQLLGPRLSEGTRLRSLELSCGRPTVFEKMCFTREGTPLPMIGRPSVLFSTLFTSDRDRERQRRHLHTGGSVLDAVLEDARSLHWDLSDADRRKMDEYFASVREVEGELQRRQQWLDRPVQKVEYPLPEVDPVEPSLSLECESIMYDLMALALQTDSTRALSFLVPGAGQVFTLDGQLMNASYHGLSHHGNDPERVAGYARIGLEHLRRLGAFLTRLTELKDAQDRPLLDSTVVLFGSGMGDANIHSNAHLPILVAGGGFQHGRHVAFQRDAGGGAAGEDEAGSAGVETPATAGPAAAEEAPRLGRLFLSLAERLGHPLPSFAGESQTLAPHFS